MLGAVFGVGRLFACSLPTGVLGKLGETGFDRAPGLRVGEAGSGASAQAIKGAELLYLSCVRLVI